VAGPWESPHSESVLYTTHTREEWPLGASTVGAYTLYAFDPYTLYTILNCMLYAIQYIQLYTTVYTVYRIFGLGLF